MDEKSRQPRRPILSASFDSFVSTDPQSLDPAAQTVLAHETAALVLRQRPSERVDADPEVTQRLIALADHMGLQEMAELWRHSAPDTLPGTLWSLYLLRAWVTRQSEHAARLFSNGSFSAEVAGAVAGVAEPWGPDEIAALGDAVLSSAFDGDFAVGIERAAAFARVIAAGRLHEADLADVSGDDQRAASETRLASGNVRMAEQLEFAARLWREGRLS